jgi:hypothetical protein
MKTLRIAMIATLVALAMASMANTDDFKVQPNKQVLNISLAEAYNVPGLVAEMYKQLNPSFLNTNRLVYTVYVTFGKTVYRISGTYEQWCRFFNHVRPVKVIIPHLPGDPGEN